MVMNPPLEHLLGPSWTYRYYIIIPLPESVLRVSYEERKKDNKRERERKSKNQFVKKIIDIGTYLNKTQYKRALKKTA